ncbi:four helix bundle protein [Patescibacteria group bacterium]
MQDFRNLTVWEKAHSLALKAYKITASFPKEELYALNSQIRRAAYSIPTNITEGCGRYTNKDFARFLQIAMGSACKIEYLFLLSKELEYLKEKEYSEVNNRIIEVKKMLASFLKNKRSVS